MIAVALGLGSSLAWGIADFLGGLASRRLSVLAVLAVSQVVGLVLLLAVVALRGEGPPAAHHLLVAGASSIVGVGALAAFYRGLAVGTMAVVAPISSTAAVVPVVAGILGGERPSTLQLAGIVLAMAGVVLAARAQAAEGARAGLATGAGLALLAALGFGSFFVLIDSASEGDVFWALLSNRVVGVAMLVGLAVVLRPSLRLERGDARMLLGVGVFDVGANAAFAVASTQGLVSVVGVCSSLYPVVTVLLARSYLGERVRALQLAGVALALTGVVAIGAGG
ncbi:MAG: DMT family transporter [Actinomycetota bacterium]|nr:DMT family transporter [Actinomycetota bacterium]